MNKCSLDKCAAGDNCSYVAIQQALEDKKSVDLTDLPNEIVAMILKDLNPQQARQVRATCINFNQILCKLLNSSADIEFDTFSNMVDQFEKSPGILGSTHSGHTYRALNSSNVLDLEKAKKIQAKIDSMKLYISYLNKEASEEEIMKHNKRFSYLENLKDQTDEIVNRINQSIANGMIQEVQKTNRVFADLFKNY
jgi:hypothetical protein